MYARQALRHWATAQPLLFTLRKYLHFSFSLSLPLHFSHPLLLSLSVPLSPFPLSPSLSPLSVCRGEGKSEHVCWGCVSWGQRTICRNHVSFYPVSSGDWTQALVLAVSPYPLSHLSSLLYLWILRASCPWLDGALLCFFCVLLIKHLCSLIFFLLSDRKKNSLQWLILFIGWLDPQPTLFWVC